MTARCRARSGRRSGPDVGGGVVERVAPRAGQLIEGEAAVGPGQRRPGTLEVVLGAVDVGNVERAGRGQGAVFGHRAGRRPGDGGGVVAAGDGDVDGLGVGAVERR